MTLLGFRPVFLLLFASPGVYTTQHFYLGRFIIVHCDNPHETNMINLCFNNSLFADCWCQNVMPVELLYGQTHFFLRKLRTCTWSLFKPTCQAVLGMERSVVDQWPWGWIPPFPVVFGRRIMAMGVVLFYPSPNWSYMAGKNPSKNMMVFPARNMGPI